MAWSTRELAKLAGTTVNTIRHYHRLGLLSEPKRQYNGYKQYDVHDLVHLLRLRRLAALGVPLSQIEEVSEGSEHTEDALREVDAELAANIEREQQARSDIAAILRGGTRADVPAGFESVASRLSEADSSIIHIYTQLYDKEVLADLREMVEADTDALSEALTALPADADESSRQVLAERMVPGLVRNFINYPWMNDPLARLSHGDRMTRQTFLDSVAELYNPAQLDVISRAGRLARERLAADNTRSDSVAD